MRVVVASDWHVDWSTLGVSRWKEIEAAVTESVDYAIKNEAGLYLFPGDLADPDTGGASWRAAALIITAATRLSRAGVRLVAIPGNHDVCEDGSGKTTLTPLAALEDLLPGVYVAEEPRLIWLGGDPGKYLYVLALPFTAASHGYDTQLTACALWPEEPGARVIVLSHLTVPGIHPGTETTEMPRGREVLYPFHSTERAILRVQGHYHHRQLFTAPDNGPPLVIPGAIARLAFGEENNDPSFLSLVI